MDDIRLFSDYNPEQYLRVWGHLPFWEDPEGSNKRIEAMKKKLGIVNETKYKSCNAEGNYTKSEGFCLGCTRDNKTNMNSING